jgi:UDP:flavonoid glycosyltransferase YjiC (YdhE family)
MNASELAGALHAVLDDSSFRDRARELGEELRLGGPDLVVDQLLSLHGG